MLWCSAEEPSRFSISARRRLARFSEFTSAIRERPEILIFPRTVLSQLGILALPPLRQSNAMLRSAPSLVNFASRKSSSLVCPKASGASAWKVFPGDSMRNFIAWNTRGSPSVLANCGGRFSPSLIVRYVRRISSACRTRSSAIRSRLCLAIFLRNFFRSAITSPFQLGGMQIGAMQPKMEVGFKFHTCP